MHVQRDANERAAGLVEDQLGGRAAALSLASRSKVSPLLPRLTAHVAIVVRALPDTYHMSSTPLRGGGVHRQRGTFCGGRVDARVDMEMWSHGGCVGAVAIIFIKAIK